MAKQTKHASTEHTARPTGGVKAVLKNYRQSPRKVRLVADVVRGKSVPEARRALHFVDKRAAAPVLKLLGSAVANANQTGKNAETLKVISIAVDKAATYKRFMPRARGSASPINRRNSHITIELG